MVSPSGMRLNNTGAAWGHLPDPPEPPDLSDDNFIRICLMDEYQEDGDFKRYVDRCSVSYGKSLDEILDSPITWEYYISLQKGGCNEKHEYGKQAH